MIAINVLVVHLLARAVYSDRTASLTIPDLSSTTALIFALLTTLFLANALKQAGRTLAVPPVTVRRGRVIQLRAAAARGGSNDAGGARRTHRGVPGRPSLRSRPRNTRHRWNWHSSWPACSSGQSTTYSSSMQTADQPARSCSWWIRLCSRVSRSRKVASIATIIIPDTSQKNAVSCPICFRYSVASPRCHRRSPGQLHGHRNAQRAHVHRVEFGLEDRAQPAVPGEQHQRNEPEEVGRHGIRRRRDRAQDRYADKRRILQMTRAACVDARPGRQASRRAVAGTGTS